jgi:hypothetical protein
VVTAQDALSRPVHAAGGDKPFGQFTLADVEARAQELRAAAGSGGWGSIPRVAAVARGWSDLARAMRTGGAATVADLDHDAALEFARRLWVVPPGGSLLA